MRVASSDFSDGWRRGRGIKVDVEVTGKRASQGHEWQYEESVSKHSAGVDWVCCSSKSVCPASVRTRDQSPLKPCRFQVHIETHLEFHPQRETRKSPEQTGLQDDLLVLSELWCD